MVWARRSPGEGGVGVGAVYLQFALYLTPDSAFALAALANAYETTKRYEAAIAAYDRIPKGTPLQIEHRHPQGAEPQSARARRRGAEAAGRDRAGQSAARSARSTRSATSCAATSALRRPSTTTPVPSPSSTSRRQKHWSYFYSRGTCYERLKKWSLAEADLQKALQLSAEQAMVLNYLGYSWIDQNRNLKQGLALIEKAVRQKPDDGYIVDSLGWAHYRMGNYKEAVKHLERAVELRPEDPVLNDHLGDAYWRVRREREARFQWDQALTLKPEPEDAEKIKKKLQKGLPVPGAGAPDQAHQGGAEAPREGQEEHRGEAASFPFFQ